MTAVGMREVGRSETGDTTRVNLGGLFFFFFFGTYRVSNRMVARQLHLSLARRTLSEVSKSLPVSFKGLVAFQS